MKKEQILDMIGQAPDAYVKDASEHKKRRRIPRFAKWTGGIAAVLALVLLVNGMLGIPLIVSARTVSVAAESRKLERPKSGSNSAAFEAWRDQQAARDKVVAAAQGPISDFTGLVSAEILSGVDTTNRLWSPINAYIALAMTAELAEANLLNHKTEVVGGVLQDECSQLLSGFFISMRQKQKEEKERQKAESENFTQKDI